jgi:2-methylcitrate dehydratase PrpD
MGHETKVLAAYAAGLRYEDIPADVVERAKHCIADSVATIAYGYGLPWSQIVVAYARHNGAGGKSRILGPGGALVHAPMAALANGALAHAFELDNLTWPSTGVHPGATLLSAGLAVAQERGSGGRALIAAFVAGAEVMIRIGRATKHSNEARGFHAPGTTGPFGAAIACGRVLGFDAGKFTNAMGIAGSLAGGLMEFARSGTGAMVKRLHLGRAAEGGVLAASLAADGFTGPVSILEGEFGFFRVFCDEVDMPALTRGLGQDYATRSIMLKRFACHVTAQTSLQAIQDLRQEHRYGGADVESIHIAGNDKMARINNIPRPTDVMMSQYSLPYCVALAHFHDPRDPRAFNEANLDDPQIRALCERIKITLDTEPRHHAPLAATVTVSLKDGRVLTRRVTDFKGTPERPLDQSELRDKFLMLTNHCRRDEMVGLFERLANLENEADLDWINVRAAST